VAQWKKGLTAEAAILFEGKRGPKPATDNQANPERLYSEIGQLKMELDWLKKSPDYSSDGKQSSGQWLH
jgi:hypothetical protein